MIDQNKQALSFLSLLITGFFTKFFPDERINAHLRNNNSFSILDLIGEEGIIIIKTSSSSNIDIPYKDPHTGIQNFKWMDWKKFFEGRFEQCHAITKWQSWK